MLHNRKIEKPKLALRKTHFNVSSSGGGVQGSGKEVSKSLLGINSPSCANRKSTMMQGKHGQN
jgi:hypothetical protein